MKNCYLLNNNAAIIKISQRATLLFDRNKILNSFFEYQQKIFSIALFVSGRIINSLFYNVIGKSEGFLLTIFNCLQYIYFEVNFYFFLLSEIILEYHC